MAQFFTGQKKDWRDYAYPPLYEGPALDRLRRVLAARAEELMGGDGRAARPDQMQTVEMMAASLNLS